ncbi:hypothetical protein M8J77_022708 [Diaphorina citri]|nr:hypothetical protein M8J77_022708 [Diaphorina citri]
MVITVQSNTEASVSMNVGYSEDPFPIYLRRAEDSYDLYVSEPQGTLITNSESQVMFTNSADPEIEVDTDTLREYIHDEALDSELGRQLSVTGRGGSVATLRAFGVWDPTMSTRLGQAWLTNGGLKKEEQLLPLLLQDTDTLREYIHDEALDSELIIRVGSAILQQHVPDLPPWEVRKRPSLKLDQHPTTLSRYHSTSIMEGNIQFGTIKEHS